MHITGSAPVRNAARLAWKTATGSCVLPDRNSPTNHQRAGAPTWYKVVGLDGFSKVYNSTQYDRYVGRIRAISDANLKKKGNFWTLSPQPYKWRKKTAREAVG